MKGLINQSLAGFVRLSLLGALSLGVVVLSGMAVTKVQPTAQEETATIGLSSASPTPVPSPTAVPLPASFSLPPARWIGQTYNNCGPATVAQLLQYFGYEVDQATTKAKLRSGSDDKNVTLDEVSAYLKQDFGLESQVLINGNIPILKQLLAAGIPVVVEEWLRPNEDIGHVLLLRGYDDDRGGFVADDVYLGPNRFFPYEQFEWDQWQPFNRIYLPVYRPQQEETVRRIVGEDWDRDLMYRRALAAAQAETGLFPENAYSWLNLGSIALTLGETDLADRSLERSRSLGWPARLLWYRVDILEWQGLAD